MSFSLLSKERMEGINGLSGSTCTTALILIRFASGLIMAVEALFQHTRFHSGAYELYQTVIEGRADRAHETLAESLGVKL